MVSVKGVVTQIDAEASKKLIGQKSLSAGEFVAFLILVAVLVAYHRALLKDWRVAVPLLILVVAMILW